MEKMIKKADKVTAVFSFMYMLMICLGVEYTLRRFEKAMPWVCYVLLAVVSFAASYAVLTWLCRLLGVKGGGNIKKNRSGSHQRKVLQ